MGKILSSIKRLFAKIMVIIAIVLVALAIIYSGSAGIEIFGFTISPVMMSFLAALSLALAYIIDGKSAGEMLNRVTQGAKDVVNATGEILGEAVTTTGNVVTTGIQSFILPILLVGGGYYLLTQGDDDGNKE